MRHSVGSPATLWTWVLIATVGIALALPAVAGAQCDFTDATSPLNTVVNSYYAGSSGTAGQNYLTVDTAVAVRPTGAPAIAAGDLLLVIQMQGADIDDGNDDQYGDGVAGNPGSGYLNDANFIAGRYEYVVAEAGINQAFGSCTAAAGKICITGNGTGNGLINSYVNAAYSSSQGQQRFQVIRVPRYRNATLTTGLTAVAWNGRTGGVLAVDLSGTATLSGTISVNGLGFRGGGGRGLAGDNNQSNTDYRSRATRDVHGSKGEGIAGTPRYVYDGTSVVSTGAEGYPGGSQGGSHAHGAPGSAGGGGTDGNPSANDENSGGGGGGNGGTGGGGGNTWDSNLARGGFGGVALPAAFDRIFLGGGGGAGSRNNSSGVMSSGGLGGGIVILRVGSVSGTATITANGTAGPNPENDGAGGAGAGGTILVVAASGNLSGLTVNANGSVGGNAWPTQAPGSPYPGNRHGPGGGGGGGVLLLSSAPAASSVSAGANGYTTTAIDSYGSTAGSSGTSQTNISFDAIPGVQTCLAVTRATIRGLRVNPDSVEFATGQQRRTLGFNLYALESPSRQATGRRLNERLVLAPVPDSVRPILYRVETGPVPEPYLLIDEIEVGGRHGTMGPFEVGDGVLRRAYEEVASRVLSGELREGRAGRMSFAPRTGAEASRGRAAARGGVTPGRATHGIKIEVAGPGRVLVPLSELVAAGLPLELERTPRRLHLTNLGRPVPFTVVRMAQGRVEAIAFDAEELSTDYTGHNVYVVTWGSKTPNLDVSLTKSGFPRQAGLTRAERNLLVAPFLAQGADPWIWNILVTGMGNLVEAFDLEGLPAGLSGPVPVRVGLVGATSHTHRVWGLLNGQPLGEVQFQGETMTWLSGQVPAEVLRATGNELTLVYEADLGSEEEVGFVCLDVVDIGVRLVPTQASYELAGFDMSLPSVEGKNYLIVTHGLFHSQADRIAELKSAEGLRPVVVDVERAYDRFAAGVFEAQAVRELIRWASRRTRIQYVLLVGDDTFDPRGFSDSPDLIHVAYIPSLIGWDGEFGRVPSENLYADLDGDGRPDVAMGRLPVQTPEQADALVEKIARHKEMLRAARPSHLVAVDNQGVGDISFRGEAEKVAALLGPVVWADLSDGVGPAQQVLMDGLRNGHLATHYFGHGGWGRWADESLLAVPDALSLADTGRGTVLFTWTCNVQWYLDDYGPSVNEALVLVPGGGALASVGPTGITDPALQTQLAALVYKKFLAGVPLGEALRQAKAEALAANPRMRPVIEGWSLLGDPALRLDVRPHQ